MRQRWRRVLVRVRQAGRAVWGVVDLSDALVLGGVAAVSYGAATHWSEPVGYLLGGSIVLGVGLLRDVLPLLVRRGGGD